MTGPHFVEEAFGEYEECVAYYESWEEGLGARLVEELEESIALAMEFPDAAAFVTEISRDRGVRWVMPASFPIRIVFAVRAERFIVIAVFHARRRPGYWMARLRGLR